MTSVVLDLANLPGTGSGRGWTYWKGWLECPKRAALLEAARAKGLDPLSNYHMRVGTIGHKLLELYETHGYKNIVIKNRELLPKEVDEAWAIFCHYRANYAPGWWGKVIATELLVGDPEVLSGRLDLLLKISTKDHLRHWREAGAMFVSKGVYITDYKFFTPPFDAIGFRDSPQFTNYWNLFMRDMENRKTLRECFNFGPRTYPKLSGTLVLGINRQERKSPPAKGLLVMPPGKPQQAILETAMEIARLEQEGTHLWENRLGYLPRISACGRGEQRCPFYLKECDLHSPFIRKAKV